jgi:hypothetical protein
MVLIWSHTPSKAGGKLSRIFRTASLRGRGSLLYKLPLSAAHKSLGFVLICCAMRHLSRYCCSLPLLLLLLLLLPSVCVRVCSGLPHHAC